MSQKSIAIMVVLLLLQGILFAQDETVKLVSVKTGVRGIEVTLSSERGFVIGAERYVLHAGDYYNAHSRHPEGDKHKIVFTIDKDAFDAMDDMQDLVLVYGLFEANLKIKSSGTAEYAGRHWKIGKLDKNMLDQ